RFHLVAIRPQLSRASEGRLRTLLSSRTQAAHRFARGLRLLYAARGRGDIVGPVGAASEGSLLIVRGVRLVLQASVQAALRALHFRGMIAPNKSFKPNALRYTNNMADKACHVVGSATHVGLTQALGATWKHCSTSRSQSWCSRRTRKSFGAPAIPPFTALGVTA